MEELKQLLKEAQKISKKLKITKQEALLLLISYDLACMHDHLNKLIFGMIASHTEKVKEAKT